MRWLRALGACLLGLLAAWSGLALWIHFSGSRSQLRQVDCIIVLGARSLPDGTPGPSLKARCDRGIELWKQGYAPYLLFTGGRGQSGTVEGLVAYEYALAQGIPRQALAYEGLSHTTRENLTFARDLMRQRDWSTCLVVTDPFHQPRSLALAQQLGLDASAAPTFSGPAWREWGPWAFYLCRETLAWLKFWSQGVSQ